MSDETQPRTDIGAVLVLMCPRNHHVGNLIQTSLTAPDSILYERAGGRVQPWEMHFEDGLFIVACGACGLGQKVYEEAQALKADLNAQTAAGAIRATHNLKYWSG